MYVRICKNKLYSSKLTQEQMKKKKKEEKLYT